MNDRLHTKLKEIYLAIADHHHTVNEIGVLSGLSGIALFLYEYAQFTDSLAPAELGEDLLATCIERINEGYDYPTYCTGIAGAGWVFDHLNQRQLVEVDNDALFSSLDPFLHSVMAANLQHANYDFLHGALGYAYYFLKRHRNTASPELRQRYTQYITDFLQTMAQKAETTGNTTQWLILLKPETSLYGYNLSLSHGISSIVNFLARLYPMPEFTALAGPMLQGAVNYILAQEHTEKKVCLFPSWVSDSHEETESRVAWCYGDPGIGISLWYAAQAMGNSTLAQKATQIMGHSAARTAPEDTMVRDAGLCHGAYGNAQLFKAMHQHMQVPALNATAQHWLGQGLAMDVHQSGYAGYAQYHPHNPEAVWQPSLSLLEGVAGIGLAIIDQLSDTATQWDESLMVGYYPAAHAKKQ